MQHIDMIIVQVLGTIVVHIQTKYRRDSVKSDGAYLI